jgi:hypothetical protein
VRPMPEWRGDPNRIPTGQVVGLVPFGDPHDRDDAVYVQGERPGLRVL